MLRTLEDGASSQLWTGDKAPLSDTFYFERQRAVFHGREGVSAGAGIRFLILPEELAFYQADEEDPWTYVWVGFGGALAPDIIKSMGLSLSNPIFKSEKGEELYRAVKDMMEHNTFGAANDLRRNGQLYLFLSLIAEGASLEEKGGEQGGG